MNKLKKHWSSLLFLALSSFSLYGIYRCCHKIISIVGWEKIPLSRHWDEIGSDTKNFSYFAMGLAFIFIANFFGFLIRYSIEKGTWKGISGRRVRPSDNYEPYVDPS